MYIYNIKLQLAYWLTALPWMFQGLEEQAASSSFDMLRWDWKRRAHGQLAICTKEDRT